MSKLWFKVEATPGDYFTDIAEEAIALSDRLEINLELDYNGYPLLISPYRTSLEELKRRLDIFINNKE